MTEIRLKRGETLNLALRFSDGGNPIDLTQSVLTAAVRDAQDNAVATLAVVKLATAGTAAISGVPTDGWPLGRLRCDARLATAAGQVLKTETFAIHLLRAVT